jgi:hypothetical protein
VIRIVSQTDSRRVDRLIEVTHSWRRTDVFRLVAAMDQGTLTS